MKKLLLCASIIPLLSIEAHALKLYLVSNHDNVVDYSQALGIGAAFQKLSPEKVTVEDLNAKLLTSIEIRDKIEKDLEQERVVFIGSGEGGLDNVIFLPKDPNLISSLAISMPLDQNKNKNLLKKVDFIAMPTHIASSVKEELGVKLIETIGVAHNHRPDMTTYDEWQKELPPADIYLGVYLGGDATTPTKEVKFFTEDEASRLADYVIVKAQEISQRGLKPSVLVLNSSETGKHDLNGKERLTVHREGKTDPITEFFVNKLTDNDIENKVFDFQHDTPENKKWVRTYNAFDLVAGAVRTTKGKMIIPGESTLTVSETIDVMPFESIDTMPPGKAFVYHNAAMNDVHRAHVASEQEAGRVSILENYEKITPASEPAKAQPSASTVIAQELLQAASVQAPWIAADSIYRRAKNNENSQDVKQDFLTEIRIRSEKVPNHIRSLIDS